MSSLDSAWFLENGWLESLFLSHNKFSKSPTYAEKSPVYSGKSPVYVIVWLGIVSWEWVARVSLFENHQLKRGCCFSCWEYSPEQSAFSMHNSTSLSSVRVAGVSLFESFSFCRSLSLTHTHFLSFSLTHTLALFLSLSLCFSLSFSVCHSRTLFLTHTEHTLTFCCACARTLARAHPLFLPPAIVLYLFLKCSFWNLSEMLYLFLTDSQWKCTCCISFW